MKKKKSPGRPKFNIDKEVLRKVEGYASRGMNYEQISAALGISSETLGRYRKLNVDFMEAIKAGQAKGIAKITNALFNQAEDGNTSAAIFYLKNRAGWADKQEIDLEASVKVKTMDDLYSN